MLEEISITDELTKVYNRRYFNEFIPKYINSAVRDNDYIGFAIMDIDHFKQYNDTYGHQEGDMVLELVAKSVSDNLNRADDYIFRLGGEEFAILFRGLDPENGEKFLNSIRISIENLNIEHKGNSASKYVTGSFGLVIKRSRDIKDQEELYRESDEMLYIAKDSGRNSVVLMK